MRGFVRDYYTLTQDPARAGNVMKCFTPETLPVLTTLAMQYTGERSLVLFCAWFHHSEPDVRSWRQLCRLR
jgi:hypothetical protein